MRLLPEPGFPIEEHGDFEFLPWSGHWAIWKWNPLRMNGNEKHLLAEAIAEARLGSSEGGIPIGAVLADLDGKIVSRGHNLRVQTGDPTAHAEVVCIRNAGRRTDWHKLVLASTLSPCIMCTGTSLLYKIPKVIIGENRTFLGAETLFAANGVECVVLDDSECVEMMRAFIQTHPDLWNEDIGVPKD